MIDRKKAAQQYDKAANECAKYGCNTFATINRQNAAIMRGDPNWQRIE